MDRSQIYKGELNNKNTNDARIIAASLMTSSCVVLDVGCACGDFGVFLKSQKENVDIYGLEYDLKSIADAQKTRAYKDIRQIDLNQLACIKIDEYEAKFDYIVILDVLEHLINPYEVLNLLKKFLKPSGFFIISFPNVSHGSIKARILLNDFTYTDTGLLDKTHLRFFAYRNINEILSLLALKIIENKSVVSNDLNIEDLERKGFCLNNSFKKIIWTDPHSYVFQYVIKAQMVMTQKNVLLEENLKQFQIKMPKGSYILLKMAAIRLLKKYCPYCKPLFYRIKQFLKLR